MNSHFRKTLKKLSWHTLICILPLSISLWSCALMTSKYPLCFLNFCARESVEAFADAKIVWRGWTSSNTLPSLMHTKSIIPNLDKRQRFLLVTNWLNLSWCISRNHHCVAHFAMWAVQYKSPLQFYKVWKLVLYNKQLRWITRRNSCQRVVCVTKFTIFQLTKTLY